jgi:putative DNA primase/helicase
VRAATDEFQRTNDIPGLFVEEACLIDDEAKVQASKLYEAYVHWCRTNGHKAQSATSVSSNWRRLGFEKKTLNGRTFYRGLEVDPKWVGEQVDYPKRSSG